MVKTDHELMIEANIDAIDARLRLLSNVSGKEASSARTTEKKKRETQLKKLAVFQPWLGNYPEHEDEVDFQEEAPACGFVSGLASLEDMRGVVSELPEEWVSTWTARLDEDEDGTGEHLAIDLFGGAKPPLRARYDVRLPGRDRLEAKKAGRNGQVVAGTHALEVFNDAVFNVLDPTVKDLLLIVEDMAKQLNPQTAPRTTVALKWLVTEAERLKTQVVQRRVSRRTVAAILGCMRLAGDLWRASFKVQSVRQARWASYPTASEAGFYDEFMKKMAPSNCFPRWTLVFAEDKRRFVLLENDQLDQTLEWSLSGKHGIAFNVLAFMSSRKDEKVHKLVLPSPRKKFVRDHIDAVKAHAASLERTPSKKNQQSL